MKQKPTVVSLPKRISGETDKQYERRIAAWLSGDDVRSKADNREWTGSSPFHLDQQVKP